MNRDVLSITLKKLATCCLLAGLLLIPGLGKAQTSLSPGDLVFTSFHTISSSAVGDTVSFVLLTNISSSTQICFSDRGYN